ncbi:MAG: alpha/beta fold hydrolase [Chloroflexi bacterium]|nr:alpha/beta fold hydrolase [Chloroflexota bacterium]
MANSQPDGYLATPATGADPGVLALHAWWGLNETMKEICDRLAKEGFTAFAPDLYDGKVAETVEDAQIYARSMDDEATQKRLADAIQFVKKNGEPGEDGIAVIGYSLGAYYALELANSAAEDIDSVVLFYGTGPEDHSQSRARYLGHFAGDDPFEPKESVDSQEAGLKAAGRPVTFYTYAGTGHWIFEPDRIDAYNEEAAALAWARTLDFLKEL